MLHTINQFFKNLSLSRKFIVGFGFIFALFLIFMIYFFYTLAKIHDLLNNEIRFQQKADMAHNLNRYALINMVLLNNYTSVYDLSLINSMAKNRQLAMKEIENLQRELKNPEVLSNLKEYVALYSQRDELKKKIISLVNKNSAVDAIRIAREERSILDDIALSHLNRILEIEHVELRKIISHHEILRDELQRVASIMTVLIFILLILVSRWITRSITAPILEIEKTVTEIGNGNLDARINLDRDDELGVLAQFLNNMAIRIKASQEALVNLTHNLQEEVGARKDAQQVAKKKSDEVKFMAYHDFLTGIPNRFLFEKLAIQSLKRASRYQQKISIFMIDLDNFKKVNDMLGHEAGDLLLKLVTERIMENIREVDTLARFGGDEFAILVDFLESAETADFLAEKIPGSMKKPFVIQENSISISASIGIATYPDAGDNVSLLIRAADIALYKSKESGKNIYTNYSEVMIKESTLNFRIETKLRELFDNNKLYMAYQPVFDLRNRKMYCVEALLRWDDPGFMDVDTERAIRVAEDSGLILPIGGWAVEAALEQYQHWQNIKPNTIKLAINLSTKQVMQNHFFIHLKNKMSELGINPKNIIFELTETAIVKDIDATFDALTSLQSLGCGIYLDDFGTGYSSLNLIRRLPITGLKIDKSFVQNKEHDPKNVDLIKMIFSLAKSMNLVIVSEGVETEEQLLFMKSFTEEQKLQGYFLSYPITPEEVEKML